MTQTKKPSRKTESVEDLDQLIQSMEALMPRKPCPVCEHAKHRVIDRYAA